MNSSRVGRQPWTPSRPGKPMHSVLECNQKAHRFPMTHRRHDSRKRSRNRRQDNVYISDIGFRQIRIHESWQPILKRLSIEKSNYQSNTDKLSIQSLFWHKVEGNSMAGDSRKRVPAFTVWP
jgi:hypothetical protein